MDCKADFPILARQINGKPLTYLDSTATAQKPQVVIDSMVDYYTRYNANIHRGIYTMAEEATAAYEDARKRLGRFIGAQSAKEVIFTRNTTEAINLVAQTWGRQNLKHGDAVLLTEMEHHSNLVPWFILAEQIGFSIRYIPITPDGQLDLSVLPQVLTERTKLVSLVHVSNVLGTINPVRKIADEAHKVGALCLVDGAQSVPHMPVNVQSLGCDFLALSGHKMAGPTGSGALWGRKHLLEDMPPFMGGGEMIRNVTYEGARWNELPWKYEAGTPAIAEGIGLGAAVDYLQGLGMDKVRAHEETLTAYAMERLHAMRGVTIYGPAAEKRGGVIAFNLEKIHPHDMAAILDQDGIAIRAGHHCAQPLHHKLGIPASARASFYVYNDASDVDRLIASLERAQAFFGV
ncbi:MAG TPA: cysteine desulfurase [Chloroflexota bacterium]|nr:cysteine desulfurase [Chloroflexota bacterium]